MNEKICYCFNFTVSDIQDDFSKSGKSTILEKVLAAKKAGKCRCGELNPKGT